jgi:two-component system chemotaxis response regulator CheY
VMSKQRVLVVDDSKAMRLIVRRTLRQAGFDELDVCEAANGKEALALISAQPLDLVLSDWNMPEMTGMELLVELRAKGIDVKLGFVTTEGTPEMRAAATTAGAAFLIAKPFTPETFQEVLRPHLG